MQKEPGPDFLIWDNEQSLDNQHPKCNLPQSEPCTIHPTINNLAINSNLQDVNISCKTVLSEYIYLLSSNA